MKHVKWHLAGNVAFLSAAMLAQFTMGQTTLMPIGKEAEAEWLNQLIPLPHEITIHQAVRLSPGSVGLLVKDGASVVEQQAFKELRRLFLDKTGVDPTGTAFQIVIGTWPITNELCSSVVTNVGRLKSVPHNEQAYLIQPADPNRLVVAGLKDAGTYFGAQTLLQLLAARMTKDALMVPLAEVTDWPDMDERGLWNNDPNMIPWLAELKINFASLQTGLTPLKKGEKTKTLYLNTNALEMARVRSVRAVPHFPHLNFLTSYGLNEAYPELVGKGEKAKCPRFPANTHRCPCASNPLLKQILVDWLEDAAAQGAWEVSIWLTEYLPCQCECADCMKDGPRQMQLETRTSLDAWREAQKKYPALKLRIFFTFADRGQAHDVRFEKPAYECLAMLPPDVKIETVYGGSTIHWKPYDEYAAKGYWVGSYMGEARWVTPFRFYFIQSSRGPAFIRKMHNLKWSAIYGVGYVSSARIGLRDMAAYTRDHFNYQISATAEWMWNVNGRSPRQFAVAWATRQGYKPPEQFADWVEIMEPLEQTMANYQSFQPWLARQVEALTNALPGRMLLPGRYAKIKADCTKALSIAEALKDPDLIWETRMVEALYTVEDAVDGIAALGAERAGADPMHTDKMKAAMLQLREAVGDAACLTRDRWMVFNLEDKYGRVAETDMLRKQQDEYWEGLLHSAEKQAGKAIGPSMQTP